MRILCVININDNYSSLMLIKRLGIRLWLALSMLFLVVVKYISNLSLSYGQSLVLIDITSCNIDFNMRVLVVY